MANNFTTDPNCVALWRMEAGALTVDSIGTNTLTAGGIGGPAESAGDFKEGACCADLESTDSDRFFITDGDLDAGFPLKTGDTIKKYSFCFWVKFESIAAIQRLFSKGYVSSNYGVLFQISAAGIPRLYHGSTAWDLPPTLVAGRWYHIGIFGDGIAKTATVRIWDDTAGTAATYTNTYANILNVGAAGLYLGVNETLSTYHLDGLLDEFVAFKDELTVNEVDYIRGGSYGSPLLSGTIAAVAGAQGNITGVSTLLEGTVAAITSVTGELTGGALQLGTATVAAVSALAGTLSSVIGVTTAIPASTGGWAMGGAGVWASSTPTDTEIPADAEPTGFYMGGGAAAGEAEVVSTIPEATEIVTEGGFAFCGPGATGNAATTFPASDVIVAAAGFAFGGAGVWGQVAPEDLPSDVLVPTGGYVLGGTGFSLDPGVIPTATVLVPTGGWKMGGRRPDPVEVTYPDSVDRVIISSGGWEFGGNEGVWESTVPAATIIESAGAIFLLGGGGLATSRMPPIAVITGDALGGFVLGGAEVAEIYEAWCLSGQAFEPSVWSAFNFNSFAVKGGQAYAANENGIYLLGGDYDAGESIESGVKIGPVNFSGAVSKRIRGIVFGKGGKNTRVRVRTDSGEGVFSPERDDDRVVVSRDIQGSEFEIDILNFSELAHLEITPLRLARR